MTLPRFARAVPRLLNPAVAPLARRLPPLAVIHHQGRRSGQPYDNPVLALRRDDGWTIGLPYGSDVNWVRNVQATRSAGLTQTHVDYDGLDVHTLPASVGIQRLPRWARPLMRLLGVREYITLTTAAS